MNLRQLDCPAQSISATGGSSFRRHACEQLFDGVVRRSAFGFGMEIHDYSMPQGGEGNAARIVE
jgi:hypothetical protein